MFLPNQLCKNNNTQVYCTDPKCLDGPVWANDVDQIGQGLHCLPLGQVSIHSSQNFSDFVLFQVSDGCFIF